MGYHRNFGCSTGCCNEQEALASVTRNGTVLNFADTNGKQTAIDLSETLPDPNCLVSAERNGTKLKFTDNKGAVTTLDLADLIPSFDGVTDVESTTVGIRITMSNGQTKDIDLSKIYTAPVALNGVSRSGTTLSFTDTAGNNHTVELDAMPEVPVAYKDAKLNGSTLRFTDTAGATHDVNLSSLIPASKADRFLSDVAYDKKSKKLTFTTSATGEADATFEVNVADLLPVSVGDGLTGNGTTADPLKVNAEDLKGSGIKVEDNNFAVDYDPETMELTVDGKLRAKQQPVPSGLDCEAIDQLPIKPWKKDTVILAKQDGQCIRLKPNIDIFTDIVVDLSAAKQNLELAKDQSETVNLIATVTNAGTNPTGEVFVTMTKPQLSTYQLGIPTTNNIGETETGELMWKVPAMAPGKSLVITLPVTLSAVGAYSFGLQATSTIDTDTTNNTKTFTFAVTAKNDGTNTNYVPDAKYCPLIIATDLTHNQRLNVYTTGTGEDFKNFGKYINVFADGRGFAGKQIKLEGASTVVVSSAVGSGVYLANTDYLSARSTSNSAKYGEIPSGRSSSNSTDSADINIASSSSYSKSLGLIIAAAVFHHGRKWDDKTLSTPTQLKDMGTFDPQTQIFTFRSDLKLPTRQTPYDEAPYHCVIWCRPAGKDCKWQGIPIVLGINDTISFPQRYAFTKVKGDVTDVYTDTIDPKRLIDPDFVKAANFVGINKPDDLIAVRGGGLNAPENEIAAEHTVTVISGQEAQFTIRAIGNTNDLPNYSATGKTSTSYDASTKTLTVTVATDATATDSIYWDDLKIIIK